MDTSTSADRAILIYRHQAVSGEAVDFLHRVLGGRYGDERVRQGLGGSLPGATAAAAAERALEGCAVVLVAVGPRERGAGDEHGRRRVDEPDDHLRAAIKGARRRGVPVVPVLVDGAGRPHPADLPADLAPLARAAFPVRRGRLQTDTDNLLRWLLRLLGRPLPDGGPRGATRTRAWPVSASLLMTMAHDPPTFGRVEFSPDGQWLATASSDDAVRFWDAATGSVAYPTERPGGPVEAVQFSPDGRWLAIVGYSSTSVRVVPVPGTELALDPFADHRLTLDHEYVVGVGGVQFSPDGGSLATASGPVQVWALPSGEERLRIPYLMPEGWESPMTTVQFSPDGRWLATAGYDTDVRVWDAATGEHRLRLDTWAWYHTLWFSPDGRWLVTKGDHGPPRFWDVATGTEHNLIAGHGAVDALQFSPDGRWLATANGQVRIWDAATGQALARLDHDGAVYDLAFSPDGNRLATITVRPGVPDPAFRGGVRIWEAPGGNELGRVQPDEPDLYDVRFNPRDAHQLLTSDRTTLRVWELR